jgi:two-component system, LuxR family, sensor kinase FixL
MEHRLVLPDGQLRWIHSRGRVEFNGDGKPILVRGVSLDITERNKAEQETQLLRQEIAHVGRVSMMSQLASSLAHEINQPLGAILRNAEAAELFMQSGSPDLDEIRAILVDIREDDQRAGKVIDRMRGLLKKHDLDTRPLDVQELVGDVAALLRADAAVRQVDLNLDVPSDLPFVRGDRVHLQQVLLNLILNGMDALNGARREDRCVSVTARLDGSQSVEIAVSDAGHGIPADKLTHVFEPFFTTKPNVMGMGLPISRTIIEAHGGRLWAENNNGGGAAFRFTLPIAEEDAAG